MLHSPGSPTTLPRLRLVASVLGLGALLSAVTCPVSIWMLNRPTGLGEVRQVRLQPGMSARLIGQALEREGLIRSARFFKWDTRLRRLADRLEAGTYELDGLGSTDAILHLLLKAPLEMVRVTIPEGLVRHQTAGVLQRHGVADSALFVQLTEFPQLVGELGISGPSLEGFLFPETYFLERGASEEDIIRRMVGEFFEVFSDSLHKRLDLVGLTLNQAVTLASIIEREAVAPPERAIISSIFHRRLALNRRLESCATVEYALGVHKKRLTNADLKVDSPYNTYLHRGLPPAPIGSPGRASILASLHPEETEYLYFVARGDGTHQFSRTNREHVAAKRAIRLMQRRARAAAN